MRHRALTTFVVALLLVAAGPVRAVDGTVEVQGLRVQYTVDPVVFDGPGCARVPWSVTYLKQPRQEFHLQFLMRRAGSNATTTHDVSVQGWDPDAGTSSGILCVPPDTHTAGGADYEVTGTVSVRTGYGPSSDAVLPTGHVPVTVSTSRFQRLAVFGDTSSFYPSVRGRVIAQSLTRGRMGAQGDVVVDVRTRGGWRRIARIYSVDETGRFSQTLLMNRGLRPGMKVRARLIDCGWCSDATLVTRARR